jgi:hypothetical protein
MTGRRRTPDPTQAELFASAAEVYPVRRPVERVRPLDLSLRIKSQMGEALKACPDNASVIAARMSEITGRTITVDALYAYTAASKPEHEISLLRFVAFVRATNATWLWDVLVEDDGLVVMEGREARLAQLGYLRQQREQINESIRAVEGDLKAAPVSVRQRRGRR